MQSGQIPRFGDYTVLAVLGQGSMGIVYKVMDSHGKVYALKALKNLADEESFKKRFFQEINISQGLLHPNIVIPIDFEKEPVPYIVFEYIEGFPLYRLMLEEHKPGLYIIARLIEQIADGLQYVHDLSIVHGDLNPKNIMITRDHRQDYMVKIVDFGISKSGTQQVFIGNRFKVQGTPILNLKGVYGTPGYICPELFSAQRTDYKSDIFSFGVIAHELLTGENPFRGAGVSRTLNVPHIAEISEEFTALFQKVLARNPQMRYRSAVDFAEDFKELFYSVPFQKKLGQFIYQKITTELNSEFHLYFDTCDILEWDHKSDPFFVATQSITGVPTEEGTTIPDN